MGFQLPKCPFHTAVYLGGATAVCYLMSKILWKKISARNKIDAMIEKFHQQRIEKRKAENYDAIAEHLTQETIERICDLTATDILNAIERGTFSCFDIVSALCKRSMKANDLLNCLTEELFSEGLERAKAIDKMRDEGNYDRDKYPLLGLPISIKDMFEIKNTISTYGMAHRLFDKSENDGAIVEILRDAGAIIFLKTTIPQFLMLPESSSKAFGICRNPYDLSRTPGGSSGGEGALIAARGSCLGMGTDIGGSGRIPATFCGIVGFKPTSRRCSPEGIYRPFKLSGQEAVNGIYSPMSRRVIDITLILKVLWSDRTWKRDPRASPIPFRIEQFEKKETLRVGYLVTDGYFDPSPTAVRAIHETVEALESHGHECVPVVVPSGFERAILYYQIMASDGKMRKYLDYLEGTGETLDSTYIKLYYIACIPWFLRPTISYVLGLLGETRLSKLVISAQGRSALSFWGLCATKSKLQREFDLWFKESKIDALLSPVTGLPAYRHGQSTDLTHAVSYTFAYNLLDVPAGTIPVTKVLAEEDGVYESTFADSLTKKAREETEGTTGLPVGVQVITLPFEDEKCLRVMAEIESLLGVDFKPALSC